MERRELVKNLLLGGVAAMAAPTAGLATCNQSEMNLKLKGNINHSVCQWTYNFIPLEELCNVVKDIGFGAIDLIAPKDWPTLQKHGIYSSMCYHGGKVSLTEGFSDKKFHEQLIKDY